MYVDKNNSIVKHLDFLILDLFMVEIAFVAAYVLRHGLENLHMNDLYFVMAGILPLTHFLVTVFGEGYKDILRRNPLKEFKQVFIQNSMVILLVFAFMFFERTQQFYSRKAFFYLWIISILLMFAERFIWKRVIRYRMRNSDERSHLLVISDEEHVKESVQQLKKKKYQPFQIVGISVFDCSRKGETIEEIPVVADWDEVFEYALSEVVDEVFLNLRVEERVRKEIIEKFLEMGITVHVNLDWAENDFPNKIVENMGSYSVLTTSIKTAKSYQLFLKRILDILGGLVGVVLTGILFVFLGPVIYIQSPGPVFFSQERVGRNGRKFRIYKFRSMYMDAEERKKELMVQNKMDGLMFKMDNDPRIFPAGKLIRKLSLDEFPQFWNILKGDMSLVGTRPPTVDEFERYDAHHKARLSIKPGLTGMWQVSGRSDITDFEEVVKLDNQYITNWSLALDVKIIWKTVLVVLGQKGSV